MVAIDPHKQDTDSSVASGNPFDAPIHSEIDCSVLFICVIGAYQVLRAVYEKNSKCGTSNQVY